MLDSLAPDLWVAHHPLRVGPLAIGTRMTVVRLSDGGLFLHSPIPMQTSLKAELDKLGPVRCIVSPNKLHHFYVAEAAQAFPDASVWVPPGLPDKLSSLPIHSVLGEAAPDAWSADLDQVVVGGMPSLNEVVFFHRRSRTLLLTDLAFNIRDGQGVFSRLFWRLNGALGRFGPTRSVRLLLRDRAQLRRDVDRILEWDFDRVTVTHGDVLVSGGRDALRRGYAFL